MHKIFIITAFQLMVLDVNYSSVYCAPSAFIKFTLQTLQMRKCIAHKLHRHDRHMTCTRLFITGIHFFKTKGNVAANTSVATFYANDPHIVPFSSGIYFSHYFFISLFENPESVIINLPVRAGLHANNHKMIWFAPPEIGA